MALRVGQVLYGAKGKYELLCPLKGSTVFKAKVLSNPSIQAEWAMIKTAATDDEKMCLKREYRNYKIDDIASSPYIRAMCDTVRFNEHQDDPSCLVFEWMDHDLRSITAPEFRGNARLPKVVSKAVLSALNVLKTLNAVHTDVNPNNIYISYVDGTSPVAKLGDLGNTIKDGSATQRLQSLPCRAPEVWRGLPCQHSSDVWSFGATLTAQLSPLTLFGPGDKIIKGQTEAWCIAKIIRLVGSLGQPIDSQIYKEEFELAEQLAIMDHPLGSMKLITRGNWREELQHIPDPPVSPDLLDFIESLLVIEHTKRPTASEALLHPFLESPA
ncbi:kinase-like protein [Cucurbitaria berberidis CBS 394.84]|uniref:Kinase-like protein n=1 Tax=Cucurbitaria berberidis CBS 394.84 TaxID=1168544 RepID=A0A9P4GM70_9PLEO|nr:kinase-like protein [Cucurbitaria berberidis CBS 394.84]KAF1848207.1 kinase-like protein [Cucurbitaria berberidis CBS 394.84]